jgi:NlpC/P60 family putative phage cell wall peptidase
MTARVVAEARRWIGTPYRHQASMLGAGTDCLGLLRGVWRGVIGAEPVTPPAYSPDWSEAAGREEMLAAARLWLWEVSPGAPLQEGEVLVFRMRAGAVAKHLGIAARRDGMPSFIHAYSGHAVVETPLSAPWARRIAGRFTFPLGD